MSAKLTVAVSPQALRRFAFFRSLATSELAALAPSLRQAKYPAHTTLFADQHIGDHFYLLLAGSVEILKPSIDGNVRLNALKPGDHFGEMSLLDDQPHSASARALTDVTVIEVPKAIFLSLIERFPRLLHQATRASDQRLRERDLALIDHLARANDRLQKLYATSLDISRHLELKTVLEAIAARVTGLFDGAQAQLYLLDSATGKPSNLMRQVIASGQTAVRNRPPRYELAAPITLQSQTLGVLGVRRNRSAFTQDDAQLLLLLANQSAIAIENARLYTLAIEKGRLDGELSAAREVQRSLIPQRAPRISDFQIAGLWQPAREVSGDLYDFIRLDAERWGIAIADVSDKGMPAALLMAATRTILRASVQLESDPARALARTNRLIAADAAHSMFVTCFLAFLDRRTRRLTYANAGHNPPLVWRARTHRLESLRQHGLVLGINADAEYKSHEIELAKNDLVLLYTDGVTDALNAREQSFGETRLKQIVRHHHNHDANQIVQAIDRRVKEFIGARPFFDDVTAVVIKTCK